MKKYFGILLLVAITAGVYYLFFSDKRAPIVNEKNFALENTDNLTRISLEDRNRDKVVLTKKDGIWYVNDTYKAFEPQMELFLNTTISKIRVKGPVPKTAQKTTIRKMVGKAIHVRLYEGEDMVRDYYVGQATPEQDASYLHINGSDVPYLAHIMGYKSLLYPKFSVLANDWIDQTVFDYEPEEIESISMMYMNKPTESFTLTRVDSTYTLSPSVGPINQAAAKSYFAMFSFKNFEGYADYLKQETKDSLKACTPYIKIAVKLRNGKTQELNLHQKKSGNGNTIYDKTGNPLVEDTERYFATFTDFPFLVTVQEYVFGKILVKRSYWKQ